MSAEEATKELLNMVLKFNCVQPTKLVEEKQMRPLWDAAERVLAKHLYEAQARDYIEARVALERITGGK